jgi:putative oxidoreductase
MSATQRVSAGRVSGAGVTDRIAAIPALAQPVLRLAVGPIMAYHGYQKIDQGVAGFADFIASLGVPAPTFFAYAVTALELGGGLLIVAGLLTRVWALLVAIEMVFTTWLVKLDVGLIAPSTQPGVGAELDLLILTASLAIVFLGPGRLSIDYAAGLDRSGEGRSAAA